MHTSLAYIKAGVHMEACDPENNTDTHITLPGESSLAEHVSELGMAAEIALV